MSRLMYNKQIGEWIGLLPQKLIRLCAPVYNQSGRAPAEDILAPQSPLSTIEGPNGVVGRSVQQISLCFGNPVCSLFLSGSAGPLWHTCCSASAASCISSSASRPWAGLGGFCSPARACGDKGALVGLFGTAPGWSRLCWACEQPQAMVQSWLGLRV